jgi:NADH-quinone oxidoreductase subunit N
MTFLIPILSIGQPVMPHWSSQPGAMLRPFVAELILIGTIVGVLLAPFFTRRSNLPSALVAFAGVALALLSLIVVHPNDGFQFNSLLVSDNFSLFWKVILLLFVLGVIFMWFTTTSPMMHEGDGPEFFTLLLGATVGMCFMASTTNLLMVFLSVEMASLPSYVLAGFRKTDRVGSEASLKYVLFGAATSSIMVFGLSYLYGLYGTLQMEQLAPQLSSAPSVPMILAVAGLMAGIGFKISAVPFHFWCPDVFEGAGVDVSVFLSVASKGAGLTLLCRLLMTLASGAGFVSSNSTLVGIAVLVGIIGAITATVGNTGALVQTNMKRLLAYSSIGHAGYMLCALSLLLSTRANNNAVTHTDLSQSAAQAILLYLAVYLFMNLGAFTVTGLIFRQTGSEEIEDYAGMGRRNPILALCMAAFMFSLVGLPPFAGFVAKLNVMIILAKSGGWWWALVVVIGVNTIISTYYYVRVLRTMYLTDSDKPDLTVNPLGLGLAMLCAAMLLLMLVAYNPLQKLTTDYAQLQLRPSAPTPPTSIAAAGLMEK